MKARVIVLAALAAAACGQQQKPEIVEEPVLAAVTSCAALEAHIKAEAVRQMDATIDGLLTALAPSARGGIVATAIPAAAPAPAGESAQDFTTTNTQEKDVDEADFVKNDGSRIFVLHDRQLLVLAAWPAGTTRLQSATPIEGYPVEMFLDGKRVVVFSRVSLKAIFERAGLPWPPTVFSADGRDSSLAFHACLTCPSYADGLKVTVLDVGGPEPFVVREEYVQGAYLSSRRVGRSVRVVSTSPLRGPILTYSPANVNWNSRSAVVAAYERLRRQNLERIRASTLRDWIPYFIASGPGGEPLDAAGECSDIHVSNAPVRLGLTTVSTLHLDQLDRGARRTHLLSDADAVYASRGALYVTARHNWFSWGRRAEDRDHTYIHKFDTSDPLRARYAASGGVPGHIVNQFAMDEEGAFFRIATTSGHWGRETNTWTNGVFVLSAQGSRLRSVGEVTALAPGERIYSARFEGDRGYLVTFRKVDPLFVLDLSVPTRPRVAGELKVPGFSTYIHPLDRDHLLTIGREAVDTGGGFSLFQELTLQVFDVGDPAAPRLMHKKVFGRRSSSSDALYDHKAFNFFASRGLLAIPFVDYSSRPGSSLQSSLEVFRVALQDGIELLGSIDHADLARVGAYRGYPWKWTPQVRRSVMMEDFVYSISNGGLKVNPAQDLLSTVVTVPFPDPLPWAAGR